MVWASGAAGGDQSRLPMLSRRRRAYRDALPRRAITIMSMNITKRENRFPDGTNERPNGVFRTP
jgi:hypothetical protein